MTDIGLVNLLQRKYRGRDLARIHRFNMAINYGLLLMALLISPLVLKTLSTVLSAADLAPSYWLGGLHGSGPPRLADRLETHRAGLAVPRQAETLARWDRQARSVGYFDEGYAASQLWKEDWESHRGTEVAATKLMWALGYNVPENHIAYLHRDQLVVGQTAKFTPAPSQVAPRG